MVGLLGIADVILAAAREGTTEVVVLQAPTIDIKVDAECCAIRAENAGRKEEQKEAYRLHLKDARRKAQSLRSRGRR